LLSIFCWKNWQDAGSRQIYLDISIVFVALGHEVSDQSAAKRIFILEFEKRLCRMASLAISQSASALRYFRNVFRRAQQRKKFSFFSGEFTRVNFEIRTTLFQGSAIRIEFGEHL